MPFYTIIYYLLFFSLFFLLIISIHRDSYGHKVPYSILVTLLIVFNAVRYNIGRDYHIYTEGFENSYSEALNHLEPFWKVIRETLVNLSLPPFIWFLLTASFIVFFTLKAYKKQSYYLPIALLAYVLTYPLYFETFNTVRQACAEAVVLFAFPLFKEKKYWQTLLILLIAYSLHRTAAIMILFLPLCFIRYPRILVGVILFLSVFVFPYIIQYGFRLLAQSKIVENFYISEKFLLPEVGEISIALLIRLAIAYYFLYRQKKLYTEDKSLLPYINALFFATFFNLMTIRVFTIGTATRFSLYFTYTYPILLANTFFMGKRMDRFAVAIILLFEIIILIPSIYASDSKYDRFYQYEPIFFDKEKPMTYPGEESKVSLYSPLNSLSQSSKIYHLSNYESLC